MRDILLFTVLAKPHHRTIAPTLVRGNDVWAILSSILPILHHLWNLYLLVGLTQSLLTSSLYGAFSCLEIRKSILSEFTQCLAV